MSRKRFRKLRNQQQFRRVYEKGKKRFTSLFVCFMLENDAGVRRFGVTASKQLGNAVRRNRAKRLMRELIRLNVDRFPISHDIVLVGKKPIPDAHYREVQLELDKILKDHENLVA